jgi:GDPmannose 4,6-dehydratase
MPKTALITGVTGQDGAYLSKFLLSKNHTIYGLQRRKPIPNTARIEKKSFDGLILHLKNYTQKNK